MSLPRPTWRFHFLHIYIYIYNIIIYCDIVVFKYIYIYTPIVCSNRGVEVIYVVKNAVPRTIQDTAYILQDTLLCRYPRQYMFISNICMMYGDAASQHVGGTEAVSCSAE